MAFLGVQSLTISLSVAMVFCTVVIVGGITISSGIDLINKARDTGDEGVALCLTSTDNDIKGLATTYLLNVLGNTQRDLEGFLDTPADAIQRMADFAQAHHPNVSTSPQFIEDKMRPYIRTAYNQLQKAGVEILAYDAMPWSPAHPNIWTPDKIVITPKGPAIDFSSAGWGGYLSYFLADETAGVIAPGQKIVLFSQTADAFTHKTSHSNYILVGEADAMGHPLYNRTDCDMTPIRFDQGKHIGLCTIPRIALYDADGLLSHARMWRNIYTADGPLNPPDVPYFQPMVTSKHRLLLSIVHTFTHPEQINLTPRQGKRVGALHITVEGDLLNDMLRSLALPNGTHLYAVQDNHWTGEKGTLIAYNKGRVSDIEYRPLSATLPRLIAYPSLMSIVNHTVEQTNATVRNPPSTIAQHGRYTMSLDGGYANASATSKEHYSEWTSETNAFETGLTYWTVTAPVTRGDLKWFVSLLVPRETVMGRIDVSTASIREKSRKSRRDSDNQQREKYIVLGIVVCLSAACLVAVAVVFTRVIVAPLNSLALDMANVAIMRLECVDLEQRSSLSEVRSMQESFVQMVANLIEYRNYMPQAVLVETEEESETDHQASSRDGSRSRPNSYSQDEESRSRRSLEGGSSNANVGVIRMKEQQRTLASDGLRKKCVTMAYYNACGWHALTSKMDSLEVCDLHGRYVETVLNTMKAYKSVCESFSGDRIVTTFNAFQALSTHRPCALRAMLKLRGDLGKITVHGKALEYSCAAVTGDARVGSLGCKGMKKLSIMSPCFPWLVCLERYACARGYGEVVDHSLARDVMCEFVLKLTDALLYAKRTSNQLKVYQLHEECKVGGDEWMYQMEKAAATSPAAAWNSAFYAALADDWDEARGHIAKVDVNTTVCSLRTLKTHTNTNGHHRTLRV